MQNEVGSFLVLNPAFFIRKAHVVQCRDSALKTRTVLVQIQPWAPPRVAQCRGTKLKPSTVQVQLLPRGPFPKWGIGLLDFWSNEIPIAHPLIHQSIFHGMSTGQAGRASVLTSACLRACGASPRHSANLVDGRWLIVDRFEDGSRSGLSTIHFQPSTIPPARVAQREPSAL